MRYIFIIFTFYIGYSQSNYDEVIISEISNDSKIKKIDSLIELNERDLNIDVLNSFIQEYSIWLFKNKKTEHISMAEKAVKYVKMQSPKDILRIQKSLYILGQFYYRNKNEKSLETLNEAIALKKYTSIAAGAMSYIGDVCSEKGDFYNAIAHYKMSESIYLNNNEFKRLAWLYLKTFDSYMSLKTLENLDLAKVYILKADSLAKIYPQSNKNTFKRLVLLGDVYNQDLTLDIPNALNYYNKAYELALKLNDSIKLSIVYSLKGNLFNTTDFDKAISYHNKALKLRMKVNPNSAYVDYGNLGYCYFRKKQFDKSIFYYNESLKNRSSFSVFEIERTKEKLFKSEDLENMLKLLTYISEAYNEKANKESYRKAISIFMLADKVLDLVRISSTEKQSRLFWRDQASNLYSKSIKACYAANNLAKLHYFIEKNKAIVLQEDIIYHQLKESNRIPKNIIAQENFLRRQIYINKKNTFSNNPDSLKFSLLNHKKELEKLNDSIKKYTSFYAKRTSDIITSLNQVQLNVVKNESIIEYAVFDDVIYGVFISKDNIEKFRIEDLEIIRTYIKEYLSLVSKPFSNKKDKEEYKIVANKLFNLFIPKSIQKHIRNSKLTIIPDNYLAKIPFEAFINNEGNYLIVQNEIQYQLSNSFLNTISKKESNVNTIAVFVPMSFKVKSLQKLPNSIIEAEAIMKVVPVELFANMKAVKSSFLSELPKHNILHLATHANANDSISPWIAFRDKKITLEELYLTKNNADLVVLSACKTNDGKLAEGEGVLSLSRGFFQTGTKSVIASLWNVDDKATANIIVDFYKNLKKKQTKSKALRNAKLSYLNNSSLSESSPYYWASLVFLGENNAIELPKRSYLRDYIISLGILLLGIFYFLFKKRG
ncbi:MAG: hypothetical protein COA88_14175 [Kordia sp.]|nr:MAG: hypothetical protein COA88_14175 [Kordia sp.]